MLVVNKAAITIVPMPSLLLFIQIASTVVFVLGIKYFGIAPVRLIPDMHTGMSYFRVSLAFLATIYANMQALHYMGVNSFVVIKCSTPLVICVLDFWLLGRELPSVKSAVCLLG
ncbi:hypothetical protein CYMTET_45873 [Cymbomonas tetramitiformis]|uniref:Uncharacterized protein n=1 Tax=Cymbomonas tetramitiformis TaxID=36881 RepID=A0AAE0BXC0_9CHLO|nr:hypothetical protein CYMTET_45873 [Cymbomonas tetramitiformis]